MDSHIRTVAKSITWRVAAWSITTAVVWVATGKGELAASIGLGDTLIKLFAYYAHERAWLKSEFGSVKNRDYNLARQRIGANDVRKY